MLAEAVATAAPNLKSDILIDYANRLGYAAALRRLGSLADTLTLHPLAGALEPLKRITADLDPEPGSNESVALRDKRWRVRWPPITSLAAALKPARGVEVSTFGQELIESLTEALAHARGEGPAKVHVVLTPREVRKQINLTQAQMAPLMGMSLSGYRKWEQGRRRVSGPAATLLQVIAKEPEAVKRALQPPE